MPKSVPDALRATADWLEANRDKHIQVQLANGENESPFAADTTCFCAYGRFLVELDDPEIKSRFDEDGGDRYEYVQKTYGVDFESVYSINDKGDGEIICPIKKLEQGNAEVIPYLRNLASELETTNA